MPYRKWIEFQFEPYMTFENYGSNWHLDHCIPCSKFDLSDNKQVDNCCHWTNYQPMNAIENISKNNKIFPELIKKQVQKIKKFLESDNFEQLNYSLTGAITTTSIWQQIEGTQGNDLVSNNVIDWTIRSQAS